MPRKKGEPKDAHTVYTLRRWARRIEAQRAKYEKALRSVAGEAMPAPSVPDYIAHLVAKDIGE